MAALLGDSGGNQSADKSAAMRLVWSRRAICQLVAIRSWIANDSEQDAALVASRILRCVELLPRCAAPLAALFGMLKGECDGVSIADATALAVCDNRRISRHRVFEGKAARGKTSMGWFFGFKLHLVVNSKGELLSVRLTPGNTDDRKPVPEMCQGLFGLLFGDKGYISQDLAKTLEEQGLALVTTLKKNMKPVPRTDFEKAILHRRSLVETVIDELKNLCQIEHTRHRSVAGFLVNLMAGVVAYCLSDNKPSLNLIRTGALVKA